MKMEMSANLMQDLIEASDSIKKHYNGENELKTHSIPLQSESKPNEISDSR